MHDYYAARAPEYDDVYLKPERQADLRAMEAWLPGRLAGASVLELACGTGHWTRFIHPVAKRVLALDAAPETLAIARQRAADPRVQFAVGDAYALSALSGSFDAAFAGFWWSHVPRQRLPAFLQGLKAALQPGARVVFIDNRFVEGSSTPVSEVDAEGNTHQWRSLADGSRHRVLKNFPSPEALSAAVQGVADPSAEPRVSLWTHYWALEFRV